MSGQERKRPHESSSSDEENKQAATNKRLDKMSEDQAATNKRLDKMSEDLAATNKRLDKMSEDQAATNKRLDKMSKHVDDLVGVQARYTLEFKGNVSVGLGCHGEIVLEDHDSRFFTFKYEGNKYTTTKERDLFDGIEYNCDKAVNSSGEFFFQAGKDTLCRSRDRKVTLKHKGRLIDSVGDQLMYLRWTDRNVIEVYDCPVSGMVASEPEVLTITDGNFSHSLSVCSVNDGRYVVVARTTQSLDTYNGEGERIHSRSLSYKPPLHHAVTAWSGNIVVAEEQPPAIRIYNDRLEHLVSKTHTQLGLRKDESVQAIRFDSNGVLHMCLGVAHDDNSLDSDITSLHAFKIKELFEDSRIHRISGSPQ